MNIKAIKAQQSIRRLDFNSFIDYQLSSQSQVINDKNSKIQTQSTFRPKSSQDLNNLQKELKNSHISELLSRKALLTVDYEDFDKVTFQPFLLGLSNQEQSSKFQLKEAKKMIGQRSSIIPLRLFSTLGVRKGSNAAKIRQDSRSPQTKKASDFKLKQSYPNIFPSRQSMQISMLKQSRFVRSEKKSIQFQLNPLSQRQQGQLKQQTFRNFMNDTVKKRGTRPPSSFYKKRTLSARGPDKHDLQQTIEIVKIRIN